MNRDMLFSNLNEYNYNPMNDVLFKFIFGKEERKQITIDFLNAVLEPSLGHTIQDITFTPTEMNPENESDKSTRLDVACMLDSGEQVDVEVQVVDQQNMPRRTLYYWTQMYLMSLKAGKEYDDLKPAITINLVNFSFLPQKEPHAVYGIYNPDNGHQLTKDLALHFLEIPKYAHQSPKPISHMTKMERWLSYFANQLDPKRKEELAMSETAIQNAMEAARIFLANTAERRRYINREMARMDQASMMKYAQKTGIEEGRKKGLEEGLAEGRKEGRKEGREEEARLFSKLMQTLLTSGDTQQKQNVLANPDLRKSLYKKYNIH